MLFLGTFISGVIWHLSEFGMILSIITINYNNRDGLSKTIESVCSQSFKDFEWIVIDGGSTDGSLELIKRNAISFSYWVSEPDSGVYNAMNKGIKQSKGDWLLFLNSGDVLFDSSVLEDVFAVIPNADILYGNYLMSNGMLRVPAKEDEISLFYFFSATIPHSGCSFIKKELFDKYGLYDESLRIVSDWKWFMQVIGFEGIGIMKIERTLSIFDVSGMSSTMVSQRDDEKKRVIEDIIPKRIYLDYKNFHSLLNSIPEIEKTIRSSWSYRIGHLILGPFRIAKRFIG